MRKFTLIFILSIFTTWSYAQTIHGVSWVTWGEEPEYEGVTGYADNPYDNPEVTIYKAPAGWSPVTDNASFDATWDLLGDAQMVANPTKVEGGDLYDLDGDATFGASWKGIHDGNNFYVLLRYLDVNEVTTGKTFEIMAQPTSYVRHEPTFTAAADSTAENTWSGVDLVTHYQNSAYARAVELGGGKAVFDGGFVSAYEASVSNISKNDWQNYFIGAWANNTPGLEALLDADHYWDETDGVIRAVLVMSLNGALSYPADLSDIEGERVALEVGETFAFDVKSNATAADGGVEYFWSADKNNGYASNYYSGHVTLVNTLITSTPGLKAPQEVKVYMHNGILMVKGGQPANLEVYNILGVKVKSARNVNKLSLQDMQNGVYLVRMNNDRATTKVVKY